MNSISDKECLFVYFIFRKCHKIYYVFDFSKIVTTIAIPMVINAGFPQNIMLLAHKVAKTIKTSGIVFVLASFSCIRFTLSLILSFHNFSVSSLNQKLSIRILFQKSQQLPRFPLLLQLKQRLAKLKRRFVPSS